VKETEIQAAICDYLAAKRVFFWRQNNVPVFANGHFRALPKHTPRGIPDIIAVKDGRAIFLEVKTTKGRLSDDQAEFFRLATLAGAAYHVVRSIDDVQALGL
jgi:hypothetical protein